MNIHDDFEERNKHPTMPIPMEDYSNAGRDNLGKEILTCVHLLVNTFVLQRYAAGILLADKVERVVRAKRRSQGITESDLQGGVVASGVSSTFHEPPAPVDYCCLQSPTLYTIICNGRQVYRIITSLSRDFSHRVSYQASRQDRTGLINSSSFIITKKVSILTRLLWRELIEGIERCCSSFQGYNIIAFPSKAELTKECLYVLSSERDPREGGTDD
jgi:hypothetical protein